MSCVEEQLTSAWLWSTSDAMYEITTNLPRFNPKYIGTPYQVKVHNQNRCHH